MKNLDYNDHKQVKELWAKHGGKQHGPNVETVTMPLENLMGFVEDIRRLAITSDEGGFMCTPDHALEVARLVSNLEAALMQKDGFLICDAREGVKEIICDYMEGKTDFAEANKEAAELLEELQNP